jgi:hypothetical protein
MKRDESALVAGVCLVGAILVALVACLFALAGHPL